MLEANVASWLREAELADLLTVSRGVVDWANQLSGVEPTDRVLLGGPTSWRQSVVYQLSRVVRGDWME